MFVRSSSNYYNNKTTKLKHIEQNKSHSVCQTYLYMYICTHVRRLGAIPIYIKYNIRIIIIIYVIRRGQYIWINILSYTLGVAPASTIHYIYINTFRIHVNTRVILYAHMLNEVCSIIFPLFSSYIYMCVCVLARIVKDRTRTRGPATNEPSSTSRVHTQRPRNCRPTYIYIYNTPECPSVGSFWMYVEKRKKN